MAVTFTYDHNTQVVTDSLPKSVTAERAAHWFCRDLIGSGAWRQPVGTDSPYCPDSSLKSATPQYSATRCPSTR